MSRQQKSKKSKPDTISEGGQPLRSPISIRLLNRLGRLLEMAGWSLANRSEDDLIAAAARQAGTSEWGHDLFREGFHVLLESLRKDAGLHHTGWRGIHYLLVSHLSNHFGIQRELKHCPEIMKQEIRRPLFITGLPRTGTTMLHRLMSTDPNLRWLAYWEAVRPVPVSRHAPRDADPRIAQAARILKSISRMRPDMNTAHALHPHYPEECLILFYNTFMTPGFSLFAHLDDYLQWLAKQDMTFAYRDYRRQLQLLQHQHRGERWVLKGPMHMAALEALLDVFPDACIVQAHRDPLKVLPSSKSHVYKWRSMYTDRIFNPKPMLSRSFSLVERIKQCMRVRDVVGNDRFYDVLYTDLVVDPIKTVHDIYTNFGIKFDTIFEANMRAWLNDNPKSKHGQHFYSLEQFGLDKKLIIKEFAEYTARFGVLSE